MPAGVLQTDFLEQLVHHDWPGYLVPHEHEHEHEALVNTPEQQQQQNYAPGSREFGE